MKWTAAALVLLTVSGCPSDQCSADNCNGCCDNTGLCRSGLTADACGVQGRFCLACMPLVCTNGACTPGGAGGGGGGTGGGSGTVSCQSGDLDLKTAAPSPGFGSLTVTAQVTQAVTILGQAGFQSDPIALCVPDDAVAVVVDPLAANALPSSYVEGAAGEKIDLSSLDALIRWVTPQLMLPRGPEVPLVAGRHQVRFFNTQSGPVDVMVTVRRGARGAASSFPVNLVFVAGSGLTQTDVDAIVAAAGRFDTLYGQAGIDVTQLGSGVIQNTALAVINDNDLGQLASAPITSSTTAPLIPNAVNLYFAQEVKSTDTAGTLLGKAMGIPGAPSVQSRNGVVVSVDAHRSNGTLDANALWVTLSHEMGHWHGLRHTSERNGRTHDLINDTPECPASLDANHDGLLDSVECANNGAKNLMFWTYDFTQPPTTVTPGQAWLLNSAVTMVPK